MESRKNRDTMVIATKFTTDYKMGNMEYPIHVNFSGNSTKSMHLSFKKSLEKLRTDYVDVLYVHWWDFTTSIEELCHGLNNLVVSGKVLYLGVSDTPAWIVTKFNTYAKDHGMRQFSVYQGKWSAADRDFERDIIPMVRDQGMAICPWGALGGGDFKTEEQREDMKKAGDQGRNMRPATARSKAVTPVLDKIAKELGHSITGVALAYVRAKTPYVVPIVGGRKISHLKDNIRALEINLTDEQLAAIDGANEFDIGFPHNFIGGDHPSGNFLLNAAGNYHWEYPFRPIKP